MALQEWLDKTVSIITNDGRNIIGDLKGFDQTINVVLENSHERIFSKSSGVEQVVLGLYIIRGDNIAIIGELDQELDDQINLEELRAEPLHPLHH